MTTVLQLLAGVLFFIFAMSVGILVLWLNCAAFHACGW